MNKIIKAIALIAIFAISGIFIYDRYSGPSEAPYELETYYDKLKPINFTRKEYPVVVNDSEDIGTKFARMWKLAELYNTTNESCLDTFIDQHPNNIVQNEKLTSLYGIEIGTDNWYKLTSGYEKYATEVCYSYSGHEIEKVYYKSLREKLTDEELTRIFEFFSTDIGGKYVAASINANKNIGKFISKKQRDTVNKEAEKYNRIVEELQN